MNKTFFFLIPLFMYFIFFCREVSLGTFYTQNLHFQHRFDELWLAAPLSHAFLLRHFANSQSHHQSIKK